MSPDKARPAKAKPRATFLGRIRAYFFAGVLITAPITITLYMTWLLLDFIDSTVMPLVPARYNPETYLPISLPGLGLIVGVVAMILIGWLAAGLFGRWLVRLGENLVARMPVVRNIYSAVKQVLETVLADKTTAFRQCVMVEFPRKDCWTIAFVTGDPKGEVEGHLPDGMVTIYVPTTPNPSSGYMVFVPREDIHELSMTVEEGIKYIVSIGIVVPPDRRPPQVRLRAKDQPEVLDASEAVSVEDIETARRQG